MVHVVVLAPVLAVRTGLRALLEGHAAQSGFPPLQVIAEAASFADLESIPPETDVLVMTAESAAGPDLETFLDALPDPPAALLLTDEIETARFLPRLPLRAWGILAVDSTAEELMAAVYALHQGLWIATPALMERFQRRQWVSEDLGDELVEPLTEREEQVLQLLAQGLANKQIAASLGISEHTVKFHVSSIYTKLGATNRAEAVRLGVQRGWVLL